MVLWFGSEFNGRASFFKNMRHNEYTISISRASLLLEKRNPRLALRFYLPLPKRIMYKMMAKTLQSIVSCINEKEMLNSYLTDMAKIKLYNRAYTLYPALYYRLLGRPDEQTYTMVRQITGLNIHKKDDIVKLKNEIKRLRDKVREFIPDDYVKRADISLERVVASTESLLGIHIDRDLKMYQFKELYNISVEKAKMYEKQTQYG